MNKFYNSQYSYYNTMNYVENIEINIFSLKKNQKFWPEPGDKRMWDFGIYLDATKIIVGCRQKTLDPANCR